MKIEDYAIREILELRNTEQVALINETCKAAQKACKMTSPQTWITLQVPLDIEPFSALYVEFDYFITVQTTFSTISQLQIKKRFSLLEKEEVELIADYAALIFPRAVGDLVLSIFCEKSYQSTHHYRTCENQRSKKKLKPQIKSTIDQAFKLAQGETKL